MKEMEKLVRELSAQAAVHGGSLPGNPELSQLPDDTPQKYGISDSPRMFIYDRSGKLIQQFPSRSPYEAAEQLPLLLPPNLGENDVHILHLQPSEDKPPYLAAAAPIAVSGNVIGYALYMMQEENVVQGILQFQWPRLTLIVTGLLSGWAVIYWLTRHLVKPIQEAGYAAKQIVDGHYHVQLDVDHQTKEISELQAAFREMAERLNKLETLRTQLLAGVTHELKTPVTSISGLVQAVKSGVVSGEEAETFLDYCLKETGRLQSMIEDLLDFNSFAAGAVAVSIEPVNLKQSITATVEKWRLGQERADLSIHVFADSPAADWRTLTDPVRLEQIIVNLLNNAAAAMEAGGRICVRLVADCDVFRVDVEDTGSGIPEEEQENIFLPFFRGKDKMATVRGLGLGLPFSRLIARSLGGELTLTGTGSEGTVFTLSLPAAAPDHGK